MKQIPSKDFFISYNNADRRWAEWIAWELEEAGFSAVLQAWDFRPGSNFVLEMHKAAEETKRTIAILSPNYLKALYTQPEWAASFVQDPAGKRGTFLPVRVQECELTGLLKSIIYIDLVGTNEQAARETLLTSIYNGRIKPKTAPNFPGGPPQGRAAQPNFPGAITYTSEPAKRNLQLVPQGHTRVIEVFFCYSYSLKDNPLREQLEKHLRIMQRQLRQQHRLIITLHNGEVGAGKAWRQEIERHLATARIILLLVSPDFLDSDFCRNVEMKEALKRHSNGKARVIPVILHPCHWKDEQFGILQALPRGDKPLSKWSNRNEAFSHITDDIRKVIENLAENSL